MARFKAIDLDPGAIITWLVVGLIVGWLAARVIKRGGYGIIGDMIVGLVGAVIGGLLFGLIIPGALGFGGSMVVAFLGACLFIGLVRFMAIGRTRA